MDIKISYDTPNPALGDKMFYTQIINSNYTHTYFLSLDQLEDLEMELTNMIEEIQKHRMNETQKKSLLSFEELMQSLKK